MANILRISDSASLALHVMVLLAKNGGQQCTNLQAAHLFHASEHTLAKVLQRLVKAGLVESTRGPHGGFRMKQRADDIRLIAIYEAVEGRIGNPECLLSLPLCNGKACVLGGLVEKVHAEVMAYLSGTSLAALAERVQIPEPAAAAPAQR